MKKLLLWTLVLLSFNGLQAQWNKVNGPFCSNIVDIVKGHDGLYALGKYDGLFYTDTLGKDWQAIAMGIDTGPAQYTCLLSTDNKLLVGSTRGILISPDRGTVWSAFNTGLPADVYIYALFQHETKIYAGTKEGLYYIDTFGDTWQLVQGEITTSEMVLSFEELDGALFAGTATGIYKSLDDGLTWNLASMDIPASSPIFDMLAWEDVLFAAAPNHVYKSLDGGVSWTSNQEVLADFGSISLGRFEETLFAGTKDDLFASYDEGESWTLIREGKFLENISNSNHEIILTEGDQLIIGGAYGIERSQDAALTWQEINIGLSFPRSFALASNGEEIFLASEKGLFASADNGTTWTCKSSRWITSLLVNGFDIYTGRIGGLVYVSHDSGETWAQSTGFFDNGQEVVAQSNGTVFARYNASIFNGGTGFISTDNGDSYEKYEFPYQVFGYDEKGDLYAFEDRVVKYEEGMWQDQSSVIQEDSVFALSVSGTNFLLGTEGGLLKYQLLNDTWQQISFGSPEANVGSLLLDGAQIYANNSANQVFSSFDQGATWMEVTENFQDSIISYRPYGVFVSSMVKTDSHLFIAGKTGIWARPLSELRNPEIGDSDIPFTIYPNPSGGHLIIRGDNLETLQIYDVLGKLLLKETGPLEGTTNLNLTDFPAGIYFVTVKHKENSYTRKVYIQ